MITDFVLLRCCARASEDLSAIEVILLLLLLLLLLLCVNLDIRLQSRFHHPVSHSALDPDVPKTFIFHYLYNPPEEH